MSSILKDRLDHLYRTFDVRYLSSDPLEIVHRYSCREDREVVGLLASSLAYGRASQIIVSVSRLLKIMEVARGSPAQFVRQFDPVCDSSFLAEFRHRFNNGEDLACLIYWMRQAIEEKGSLGDFFLEGYRPEESNLGPSISRFVRNLLELDRGPFFPSGLPDLGKGVRYLLPTPEDGSACKRINLYLRWMVRRGDRLDLGLWREVSTSQLVIPLDSHVLRISRYLGLTTCRSASWATALEVTKRLQCFDAEDPVKYDFSLCRLGILEFCPKKRDYLKCRTCPLVDVCQL